MIHLCHLKVDNINDIPEDVYLSRDCFKEDDLIITNIGDIFLNEDKFNCRIMASHNIDFEYIGRTKLDNILMFDLNMMNADDLIKVISIKSKKTEILGLTICESESLQETLHSEVQRYKDSGFGSDEIVVLMGLKYNYHLETMYELSTSHIMRPDVKLETINNFQEILVHLKRK